MTAKNLWGEIPQLGDAQSPKRLMQEQAQLLTDQTTGLLRRVVQTEAGEGIVTTQLLVVAPFINNFTVGLVRVTHGVLIYPVNLFNLTDPEYWEAIACPDYESFEKALANALKSGSVRSIISSLLIQSREK